MLAYWALIALPVLLSIFPENTKQGRHAFLFFIGIIYVIFTGFRHEISIDWGGYLRMYNNINWSSSFIDALSITEPGFVILNWLISKIDLGVYGVNFIVAIIFISGLFRLIDKMPMPWLALVSVTPYLIIVISMSAVRQTAAIGMIFHLIVNWNQKSIKKISLALIATAFHYTAFFSILLTLQSIKMPLWVRWSIFLTGGWITFNIFSQTQQFNIYYQSYAITNIFSPGALQHITLNAIPAAIYLIFIQRWNSIYGKNNLMPILSYLSLLSIIGIFISSTAIDRLSLYLSPIQILVYGTLPIVFKHQAYTFIIILIHLVILYIWLNYSNTAYAFIPYKSILFN